MLPPTDSLRHQNLKVAELISTIQAAQSNTTTAAPRANELAGADDDCEYMAPRQAPITINIDSSLKIEGHANTVVVQPSPSPSPNQSSPSGLSGASSATQPSSNGRAEKLTTVVLVALKDAGLFTTAKGLDGQPMPRQVDVHVNAGIILRGGRNTVCSGWPRPVIGPRAKPDTKSGENSMACGISKRRATSEPPQPSSMAKRTRCS